MKKTVIRVLFISILVLSLSLAITGPGIAQDTPSVALIVAQGGLGDRSYNDLAFAGLTLAAQELGVEVVPIESPDPVGEGEQLLRAAAEAGFDLVITLEFSHFDPLARVAPDYPDTLFSIVNIVVEGDNIVSIMFDEHTGSYLAGMLAALVTTDDSIEQTNDDAVLGAIGGVPSSGIDVFLYGYLQGACAVNPDVDVLLAYSNGFGDPAGGRELALSMHEQGADVIFQVAGGTGEGIIDAARDENFFAVGVDSDQDFLAPGNVLTSMMKRVDVAVFDVISRLVDGTLEGGTVAQYGLDVNGVGLTDMTYTRHIVPPEYVAQVEEAREAIIAGDLDVVDIRLLDEDTFAIISENPTCAGLDELHSAMME
ncbi:MAG: BMP family ABC transporter substrate-binding protein [Anaerolineae bacterium]|nr:BMP family ABC transporter substrate-binding protein [Anaerolineae bacterium]MCA9896099.1 BMP family ABC transporter substrate-binding protein [Anaerolineae bacterium]MCB9460693.1 BMP family ABC transporter substrate-binding protein [Anaerolineaceae bacterium]